MDSTIAVGLAMSPRSWRKTFHSHCRDHVADVAIRLVRDAREAFSLELDVIIVDDDTSWLSRPFVDAAADRGLVVIGLFASSDGDGYGQHYLRQLGISIVADVDQTSAELADLVRSSAPDHDVRASFTAIVGEEPGRIPLDDRQLVVVGGPSGSGATEVAAALATSLSTPQHRAILVDLDETHPSVARRLGLSIHPHLLTAIEALRGERLRPDGSPGETIEDCLARRAVANEALPFDVITGVAAREDWTLLRSDEAAEFVDELCARWPVVIGRLGPNLEDLSRWVERYETSRAVARKADRVIAVCEGTAMGVLRFVDWMLDMSMLLDNAPVDAIINKAPSSAALQRQIEQQVYEIVGGRLRSITSVPFDRRVERAAWDGALVHKGPLFSTLRHLAQQAAVR